MTDSVIFNFFILGEVKVRVFRFDEIDSTNRYLKDMQDKKDYDCVIAKTQTSGVGRRGNHWVSNEGMALFSFAVNEKNIKEEYTLLPLITGMVVIRALEKIENLDYRFKWTNDIYLRDRKLCGILVEKVGSWFVIGIGININNMDFESANDRAISIRKITQKFYNIGDIIYLIVDEFKKCIENESWEYVRAQINSKNYLLDREIGIEKDGVKIGHGTAGNIATDGRLEVEIDGEVRYFDIGEIHILK